MISSAPNRIIILPQKKLIDEKHLTELYRYQWSYKSSLTLKSLGLQLVFAVYRRKNFDSRIYHQFVVDEIVQLKDFEGFQTVKSLKLDRSVWM